MPEGISKLLDRVKTFWKEMEKGQKTRVYIMAAILVLAVILTLVFTLKVNYVPLFETTEDVNMQPVVTYLTENNIKFKKGDNNQIFVDSKVKKDIEFDLTTQGIVSPEVTFSDTWSKLSLTATEADKDQLWKNYLTNDLVYKLKKFENVENATIQYNKPEQTYWAQNDNPQDKGSAYVMLKTKKALTPEQVDAASRVVAASLGIPADNITLVDQNLNPLNRNGNSTDLERASTQEEMRMQRQMELEGKIYDLFKIGIVQHANFDSMSISANPVLDFDTLKSVSTKYTAPDEDGLGFIKDKETLSETIENGTPGNIPGTDTNPSTVPSYQTGDGTNSNYNKDQNVESRIFNETNEEAEKAIGKLINDQSTMSITLWYGKNVQDANGLTPEYLDEVRSLANNATGIPKQNITVSIQKLLPEQTPVVTLTDTLLKLLDAYGFYAIMLVLLIVMVLVAMPRKKRETALQAAAAQVAATSAGPVEIEQQRDPIKDINVEEQSELKKQIEKFVMQNPDAVAQLLRNWIADDWD